MIANIMASSVSLISAAANTVAPTPSNQDKLDDDNTHKECSAADLVSHDLISSDLVPNTLV